MKSSDFVVHFVDFEKSIFQLGLTIVLNVQSSRNSQLFAVSDEDGYVSLFNSNKKFASSASHQENTGNCIVLDDNIIHLC